MISATPILVHHSVKYSMNDKQNRAMSLFIESVLKPDSKLRGCAYNQECFDELMELREEVLSFLYEKQQNE
jgi:hypothetical protein